MAIETVERPLAQRAVPGPRLTSRVTLPEAPPTAMLGILPGYADHAERYDAVAQRFALAGYGVVALDMRGHGKSEGRRGSCLSFNDFLADATELPRLLGDVGRGIPQFLLGHSFGGLVATHSVLAAPAPWRGVLLSSPFFELVLPVPKWKVLLGRAASRVAPHFGQPAGVRGRDVTHDPVLAARYDTDPLVFKNASSRWFTETTAAQQRLHTTITDFALPIWVGFGTEDKLASLAGAQALVNRMQAADKTFVTYPGLYHEILNEPCWESICDTMIAWTRARLT
jgi:acylglycerol lipase